MANILKQFRSNQSLEEMFANEKDLINGMRKIVIKEYKELKNQFLSADKDSTDNQ